MCAARLEAGLSQRQLCGEEITRNMLSLIEHGEATPSLATLRYLAEKLHKPVSYFLEETALLSPNQPVMEAARQALSRKDGPGILEALSRYQLPDPFFDAEEGLLLRLGRMLSARQALREGRSPYAAGLLAQAEGPDTPYWCEALEQERLLLLAEAEPRNLSVIAEALPDGDGVLLLRAAAALQEGNALRAAQLLDAAENSAAPRWNLLRGEAYFSLGRYREAVSCYLLAEPDFPRLAVPRLETCYKETEDYKMAYLYACKGRELKK